MPPAWQGAPLGGIPLGGCVWVECARPELFLPEWPGHYGTHPLGTHARTPPFFGGATHRGRAVERGGKNPEKKKRKKMLPPPCLPASGEAPAPGWGPLFGGGTLCGLALQSLLSPLPGVAHLETLAGLGSGWLMIETPAPGSSQHLLPKSWGDPAVPPTNTHIHTSTFDWPLCSRRPAARRWRLSSFPGRRAHGAGRKAWGAGSGGAHCFACLTGTRFQLLRAPDPATPSLGSFSVFPLSPPPVPGRTELGTGGHPMRTPRLCPGHPPVVVMVVVVDGPKGVQAAGKGTQPVSSSQAWPPPPPHPFSLAGLGCRRPRTPPFPCPHS